MLSVVAPADEEHRVVQRLVSHLGGSERLRLRRASRLRHLIISALLDESLLHSFCAFILVRNDFAEFVVGRGHLDLLFLLSHVFGLPGVTGPVLRRLLGLHHDAGAVHLEVRVDLELSRQRAVHEHFFLDVEGADLVIVAANVVRFSDLRVPRALGILSTAVAFGFLSVWCAILANKMTVLSEEAVENGPAAVASFIHIITLHEKLG